MFMCYVDESGCLGALPSATSPVQPVLIVTALLVERSSLAPLTTEFLELKSRYFAGKAGGPFLDRILLEIKGNEVRKAAASSRRREWRQAIGFLNKTMGLAHKHGVRIVSRVWIKGVGQPFNGNAAYAYSVQNICTHFQRFLEANGDHGLVIADNRRPAQNRNVSHSIFTQKFKTSGDGYARIFEMPTFGDSRNHAGLQLCDLLCSAVVQPIAVHKYCAGHVNSLHVKPEYSRVALRFQSGLRQLQYRYIDSGGRWTGGIIVSDGIAKRSSSVFFA